MKEKEVSPHPEWVLAHKRKNTEIRCFGGQYYLYQISSRWDKERKRSVKITGKLLGKITEKDGFVESEKARLSRQQLVIDKIQVKEYGFTSLIENKFSSQIELLKKHFPTQWQGIMALAYGRLLHQSPLKKMFFHYSHSYLSELYPNLTDISSRKVSDFLRELGYGRSKVVDYFKEFNSSEDCILFDGTDIFSSSEKMDMPKFGKSKLGTYDDLINAMHVFSVKQQMPVYYRLLPGNIKDVKAFRMCLAEIGITDATVIIDKGFFSKKNLAALEEENLKFIIPLQRNSNYIDYQKIITGSKEAFDGYFCHEERFIWYYAYQVENGKKIFVFLDDELKNREEKDYLTRIENGVEDYCIENFLKKQPHFGTIAMIENTGKSAKEVYLDYKTRGEIETMIDALKNVLDADHSYMQNNYSLEGWMFVNHIALQWYYYIIQLLKENELNSKYSVNDFIKMMLEIKTVKINNKWYQAEITKATEDLLKKLNLLPVT
jgi:transposase